MCAAKVLGILIRMLSLEYVGGNSNGLYLRGCGKN